MITYAIQAGRAGPFKFGRASSDAGVERRLASLQCGNHEELTVVATSTTITESEVHRLMARYRIRGEWFENRQATRALITKHFRLHVPWLVSRYHSCPTCRRVWSLEDQKMVLTAVGRLEYMKAHGYGYPVIAELMAAG